MSIENLNNTGSWRSKLDDLEGLPGETPADKNAAYEKLHARLRGKKRSRKAMWYWAAAACLLLAFMIPLIFKKDKIHPVAGIETEQNQQQKNCRMILLQSLIKKDPVTIITPLIEKEKEVVASGKINRKDLKIIPVEIKNKIRLYDTVISTDFAKENIGNSLQPVDSASSTAAASPRKKLKVVHVNELGDPVEVSPEIANKKELRSFQLELASQEVYSHSPVAFNKNGFTIFKTKSPSN